VLADPQNYTRRRPPPAGGSTARSPLREIITGFGCDLQDPSTLHGEIGLWLEDEQGNLIKNFVANIPSGLLHCPLKHTCQD
jgi:hypothetical protein